MSAALLLRARWSSAARLPLALALLWCVPATALAQPSSPEDHAGEGALRRYGCASCHQIEGVHVSEAQSCVGCHARIVRAPRSGLGRAPHVEHYVHAPDLRHVARRLREDYLVAYLQDPHDARPRLEETMPRLPVTEEDARLIAGFLRRRAGEVDVPASPAPSVANVEPGRAVFVRSGCALCHEVGNLDLGAPPPPAVLAALGQVAYEAPNLRYVRDRMHPDVALAWILDPRRIDPNTQMPHAQLSPEDARRVRDFLFLVDPGPGVSVAAGPSPSELRPLARPVRYAEVRRVFDRSCIHCHAHTDGRSASAFGFAPSSLDLSSASGVRAGVLLPDGSRRSVLAPDETGLAPLVARLLRRHEEAGRDVAGPRRDPMTPVLRSAPREAPGMPLGLPPVAASDLRVVATWVAQGAPD